MPWLSLFSKLKDKVDNFVIYKGQQRSTKDAFGVTGVADAKINLIH